MDTICFNDGDKVVPILSMWIVPERWAKQEYYVVRNGLILDDNDYPWHPYHTDFKLYEDKEIPMTKETPKFADGDKVVPIPGMWGSMELFWGEKPFYKVTNGKVMDDKGNTWPPSLTDFTLYDTAIPNYVGADSYDAATPNEIRKDSEPVSKYAVDCAECGQDTYYDHVLEVALKNGDTFEIEVSYKFTIEDMSEIGKLLHTSIKSEFVSIADAVIVRPEDIFYVRSVR